MDDPGSIPPLRAVVQWSKDRQGRPDAQRREPGDGGAEDRPAEPEPPAALAEATPEQRALVAALDRLRATGSPRTADQTLLRCWHGLRAYQAAAVPAPDPVEEPPAG